MANLMNRQQWIALAFCGLNLALILLFPPFDYVSLQRGNVPTFAGFFLVTGVAGNLRINYDFLVLEVLVVLVNAGIAWLLLRSRPPAPLGKVTPYQKAVLWLVGANLVAALLFPPFENYFAITKAALPTFDGFYFIFGDNSQRQIVATILYIEMALILINGGLLWLLFKGRGRDNLSPDEIRAIARKLRDSQGH